MTKISLYVKQLFVNGSPASCAACVQAARAGHSAGQRGVQPAFSTRPGGGEREVDETNTASNALVTGLEARRVGGAVELMPPATAQSQSSPATAVKRPHIGRPSA